MNHVRAGVLDIAFESAGPAAAVPVVLLHGFPYDVRAFDGVVRELGEDVRTIVPYLRGYGATRFRSARTMRSGQQGALASDLVALLDALRIERAVLAGYDWGGRAACIVAALHPDRAIGLVTGGGYNIQHLATAANPGDPAAEARLWYQYYFHGERGYRALVERRDELCEFLWRTWSPTRPFDRATFERTARSFDNPDFPDVVAHSYRHRYGLVAGDPAYAEIERALEEPPRIDVPTIALYGSADGVFAAGSYTPNDRARFGRSYERRDLENVGHDVPQEAPRAFADAVRTLLSAPVT